MILKTKTAETLLILNVPSTSHLPPSSSLVRPRVKEGNATLVVILIHSIEGKFCHTNNTTGRIFQSFQGTT